MSAGSKHYCDKCEKLVDTVVREKAVTYDIKGSKIEINSSRRYCEEHDHSIYDYELDNESTKDAIKKYNELYGIKPEEIKNLRSIYNISQGTLGKILGVAKKTINAYEQGNTIPQDIYKTVLNYLVNKPEELLTFAKENINELSDFEIKKIFDKTVIYDFSINFDSLVLKENSEYSGYQNPDPKKIKDIILRIAEKGIGKTKLAKALFFIDAVNYSTRLESITGLNYAKMPHGPMPDDFDFILGALKDEELISEEINEVGMYTYCTFKALKNFDNDLLSEEEINVVNKVIRFIEVKSAGYLSELTHDLKCYIETENNKIISFAYLDDFDLIK